METDEKDEELGVGLGEWLRIYALDQVILLPHFLSGSVESFYRIANCG